MIPRILGGAARNFAVTARSAVTDLVTAASYLGEWAGDRWTAREPELGTLRVAVLILSDARGPLCTEADVLPSLDRADKIFREEAGIRVRTLSVRTIAEPAPQRALEPRANQRLLLDDIQGHTEFYRRQLAPAGVGSPVTVVVVREIEGRTTGCSLGMTADWVIGQRSLFLTSNPQGYDNTVLAHELGHALNLPHHSDQRNLMFPSSSPPDGLRGTALRPWQGWVLGANRHTVPGLRS